MASNGMGVTESIVHAPRSNAAGYVYRNTMGMVPSAEFLVAFYDFNEFAAATTFAPPGWTTILSSGATIAPVQTADLGATGVISLFDATAAEGASIYQSYAIDTGVMQLTVGKRAFFEARIYTNDVLDNSFQMGFSSATVITAADDLWDTSADDLASIGIMDADVGVISIQTDKANQGITKTTTTGTLVATTWTVLAISWDGVNTLRGYQDGQFIGSTTTNVPTGVALTPFIGAVNGDGAGGNLNYVDYVRYVIER